MTPHRLLLAAGLGARRNLAQYFYVDRSDDGLEVGGEALRYHSQMSHLSGLHRRDTLNGIFHKYFKLIPVLIEFSKLEMIRNTPHTPWLCNRLKPTHQKATHFLPKVDVAVHIAHGG